MTGFIRQAAVAMLLASTSAWAAAEGEAQTIEIKALRNPVDKSYRKMLRGMELFEQMHAMAPKATLRFELLPRKRDTDMDDIPLRIVGEHFKRPVTVAADHTFVLERDPQALQEDAVVRSERKAQTLTWRAEIRTPGLPADTRRLGDLRLECSVGMEAGLVSRYPSLFGRLFEVIESPREFCNGAYAPYLFFAERPLFSVTLTAGGRREMLSVGRLYAGMAHGRTSKKDLPYCDCEALLDRAYTLPLGDRSWPDDTLVELEYMDTPPAADKWLPADAANDSLLIGSGKTEVRAWFGEGNVVRFDSGFEVWAFSLGPKERPPLAQSEFVMLFDPSGRVAKTRLRAPG